MDREDGQITVPRTMRFGAGELRQLRQLAARWAARVGLPPDQAEDFVIAVNEVATNAVRHGSPTARLVLRPPRSTWPKPNPR